MIQIRNNLSQAWGNIDPDVFWELVKTGTYQPLVVLNETQQAYFEGMKYMLSEDYKVILDPTGIHFGYIVRAEL